MKSLILIVAILGVQWTACAPQSFAAGVGASSVGTLMLGALPGVPGTLHVYTQLIATPPAETRLDPLALHGEGTVYYHKDESLIRIRGSEFVQLGGTIMGPDQHSYAVRLVPVPKSVIEVHWDPTLAIRLEAVTLRAVVVGDGLTPVLALDLPTLRLTTGSIEYQGRTVRGLLDLDHELALFVGSFTMPEAGITEVDERLAGQEILLQYQVGLRPLLETDDN